MSFNCISDIIYQIFRICIFLTGSLVFKNSRIVATTLLFNKFPQRINEGSHHAEHKSLPVTETP